MLRFIYNVLLILGEEDATSDHAVRLWKSACGTLMAPAPEEAWVQIEEHSAPNTLWHSLKNCVAHQVNINEVINLVKLQTKI